MGQGPAGAARSVAVGVGGGPGRPGPGWVVNGSPEEEERDEEGVEGVVGDWAQEETDVARVGGVAVSTQLDQKKTRQRLTVILQSYVIKIIPYDLIS